MNTVFDPSLIWISEKDWYDKNKRDQFLSHLMDNLYRIDDYKITRIYWSEQLESLLWDYPQSPPWRIDIDFRNYLIPILHTKFHANLEHIEISQYKEECNIEPNLVCGYDGDFVNNQFNSLIHTLLVQELELYFCVGIPNKLIKNYRFICHCHHMNKEPVVVSEPEDWDKYIDLEHDWWPKDPEYVDRFVKAIFIKARINFNTNSFMFKFKFSNKFIEDIINENNYRKEIIYAITKRLVLNKGQAATDKGLQDEPVKGKNGERRFRVTKGNRIHYKYQKNTIIFLRYYGDGEHDTGLY